MSSSPLQLKVRRLYPDALLPVRASADSAGYDLFALSTTLVQAKGLAVVKTGISLEIPPGHYGRCAPRSGLAVSNFIDVGAGVIDADYRGQVSVVLYNFSDQCYQVNSGDRIAQLILEKISTPPVVEVTDLCNTERGSGGFGSTGV